MPSLRYITLLPPLLFTLSTALSLSTQSKSFQITSWTSIVLYLLALLSLSFRATEKQDLGEKKNESDHGIKTSPSFLVYTTKLNGILAAASLLAVPFLYPETSNPLGHCILRVVCFFYACKLLDLTVTRVKDLPQLLKAPTNKHWRYMYLLLTEYRYRSFNIAVIEKGREHPASKYWTYGPPLISVLLAYSIPTAETLFLFLLSTIYISLEFIHTILHRGCESPLFYQPFAASSITEFWSIHWHQGARPFLYSLGYVPAKNLTSKLFGREVGSAFGVLATFSLSGIWHGWAVAALVEDPWIMGISMWAIFVGHGVACIVERAIWKGTPPGMVRGVVTWILAVVTVSMWVRAALPRARVYVPWPPR